MTGMVARSASPHIGPHADFPDGELRIRRRRETAGDVVGPCSAKEVAERVATRLGERGNRVELQPAGQAGRPEAYDAVVFGSAVYDQAWLPEGEGFVCGNQAALAGSPVWLFSVGLAPVDDAREHAVVARPD